MEFRLLGAFEVWDGEQSVEITGSKRRALLALLVLRANEVVRSELLVDELWGERPPRNAAAALQTHVSRLRKTLGADTLASREWGYVLRANPEDIDLKRFEGLLTEADPLAAQQRAVRLAEALALWRGSPLADLANESALQHDIARLEELRQSTLERRIEADLEAGRSAGLVGELETLVARQPLREHLRWLLILALYRTGRQAEALEVYRETRRVLTEELGLEPSPALKELEQAILRQDPSLEADASPTHTDPPTAEPESKRRRVPPVALLALLALGLAGTATAIALVRPEKGTSSRAATEAIFQTLPTTANPTTDTQGAADGRKTTTAKKPAVAPAHTASSAATTTKPTSTTRPTKNVVHKTNTTPTHVTQPPRRPVTIADNFSDLTLDPLIWTTWTAGAGSSYSQANGQAVFSIPANTTFEPQYHSAGTNIATKCKFPGNFDVRVSFSLLQWPAGNGATVSLVAYNTGPVDEISRSTTTQYDIYTTYPAQGNAPLADTSGFFRMTRKNGILRTYIWHHDQWKTLSKLPIRGGLSVGVSLWTFANVWRGQPVSAAFDNFVVKAPRADCPAGSTP